MLFLDEEDLPEEDYNPRKRTGVEIPDIFRKDEEPLTDEQIRAQVVLNNIPGSPNPDYEKKKHLDELDNYSRNFDYQEWDKVLENAPFELMFDKLRQKMSVLVEYRSAMMDADEIMKKVRL